LRQRKQSNITANRESGLGNLARTTPRKQTQTPSKINFRQNSSHHKSQVDNFTNDYSDRAETDPQTGVKTSNKCVCCGDLYFEFHQQPGPELARIMNRIDPGYEMRIARDD